MADIARLSDKVIVINDGKLLTEGSPREVFSMKEELAQVGLDLPPITEFTESLRERGIDLSPTILDADEAVGQIAEYLKKKSHKSEGRL